jgi:ribosomal protein S19
MFLCKSIFSFSGGPYELFRGTSLKEKLDAGYVFILQTAKTRKIQSWSRDKTIAHDFIGGGFSYSRHDLYVIRGRIPTKLIIATDTMWESLGEFADSSLGKKYFSRVADGLLAQLPERFQEVNLPAYYKAKGNQSLRKAIAIAVSKSLAQICSLGLLHGHEREAVIDFTSGFKPSCEVVYRERG